MRGASIITAILCAISINANAYDYERVIVRPDKRIADATGKVIAEPNPKDPRNNQYELFYRDPSKECNDAECPSDFSIIYHPELGYVKKPPKVIDLNEEIERKAEAYKKEYSEQDLEKMDENKVAGTEIYVDPYNDEPDMSPRY